MHVAADFGCRMPRDTTPFWKKKKNSTYLTALHPEFQVDSSGKGGGQGGADQDSVQVVSFLTFICYVVSTAVSLMTVPLLEFLWALFTFFAYSTKLNEQLKGILWPLLDFIRCVSAAIIYFVVSLVAVSKYSCGWSKAAAVLGFIATIVFAIDFYIIFNDLIKFLKKGESNEDGPQQQKSDDDDFDSDSD